MTKSFLLVGLIIVLVSANVHLNSKYQNVLHGATKLTSSIARTIYSEFNSVYAEKSEQRYMVFLKTLEEIIEHNKGQHTWVQGLNDYSDISFEQFKKMRLMEDQNCSATYNLRVSPKLKAQAIPESYEWNNFGVVTPVKNQASCGSCWTFSTVGALQAHWNILGKGRNVTFSEQQLVDCAGDFDNFGCRGGLPSHAFEYIKYAPGIQTDITYPYTAKDGQCVFRKSIAVGYAKYGSYNITQGDQVELAERLYNAGPIAVSFQVIAGFKNYVGGVYKVDGCGTGTQDVNHAVLATGYGVLNGQKFWNIKNSWGATWGSNGYFLISRGTNMCAIGQCNSYPLIDRLAGLQEVTQ